MSQLTDEAAAAFAHSFQPSDKHKPPQGDWATWLLLAGRGFGKTRTGTAWVDDLARTHRGCHIALVGATLHDARSVMVEGASGLVATHGDIEWQPGLRRLHWPDTGATAMLYSAEEPGALRGPQFNFAWGDEAARWGARGPEVLSNLRLGLRMGRRPRLLLTTTPLPLDWLKALAASGQVVTTRGRTHDNRHNLPASFIADLEHDYGGSQLARQELDGEFVEDREGALWTRALLDGLRVAAAPPLVRVVVAVDPPAGASAASDECGIVVAGLGEDGIAYVVGDYSLQGALPAVWSRAVARAAAAHDADLVIAEANNGGEMVAHALLSADIDLNVRLVRASTGKVARAEPVSTLYANARVRHVGALGALEDQLCGLSAGGTYAGPGRSPDRADALVWALAELMPKRRRGEPGLHIL